MDASSLQYRLTPAERDQFDRDGYFIVEGALPPDLNQRLEQVVDRLHADGRLSQVGKNLGVRGRVHHPDFLSLDKAFIDLVDHERTFPKVWDILGWNIYIYHTHLGVTERVDGAYDPEAETLGFHQDSIPSSRDMPEVEVPARLSLKIGYVLTDMSEPGRGNFWAVPGSHRRKALDVPSTGRGQPDGAIPLCCRAGAAIFFDRRLWHAASPNHWHVPRKFLAYGYGYRWLRTKDEMTIPPDMFDRADPIRRQLLGHTSSENNRFNPADDDVPLRGWLDAHATVAVGADGPVDPN